MYAAVALLLLTTCLPSGWMVKQTALDDYVKQHDPHYSYTLKNKEDTPDVTIYTLNMTSLKWLDGESRGWQFFACPFHLRRMRKSGKEA